LIGSLPRPRSGPTFTTREIVAVNANELDVALDHRLLRESADRGLVAHVLEHLYKSY
jgi:hypothetical protein